MTLMRQMNADKGFLAKAIRRKGDKKYLNHD